MLGNDLGICKAITANEIWDFHLIDRIVCYGGILTNFIPTVGGVSLAETLALMKVAGGAPVNDVVGISILGGSSPFMGKDWLKMNCRNTDRTVGQGEREGIVSRSAMIAAYGMHVSVSSFAHQGEIASSDAKCSNYT
ncbi:hypothetical protein GIB67_017775 [Kingdonia uniflora]|uniref:Uncharacterized protein n=1 Tax=Kingdonia uniflora TaxID=39325 RepID=A0A7J7MNX7_9MAGN|nr:hypothetical protein GIB67_017775 [Kingdonia uniflora]